MNHTTKAIATSRVRSGSALFQSLATWKQFGRPGIFIDKRDVLYVADSESADREYVWSGPWAILAKGYGYNPGVKRGIRVGSARDGSMVAFIPEPYSPTETPNDPNQWG